MPPEDWLAGQEAARLQRLRTAQAALGLDLDEPVLVRLMAYLQLLQRWNRVYNLTALRDPDEMLSHHLVDCLAAVPALRAWACQRGQAAAGADSAGPRLLDVGSGGGLPGVVLAALAPGWQVSCVDTVAKKASFIKQVAAELRLPNLQGLHARVESLPVPPAGHVGRPAGYDLITARAFASLPDFVALTAPLLAPQGAWMAMKGRVPDDELAALPDNVEVFHVEQLAVPGLDAQRCLVWMRPRTG